LRAKLVSDTVGPRTARRREEDEAAHAADRSGTYTKGIRQDGINIVNQAAAVSFKEELSTGYPGELARIVTGGLGVLLLLVYAVFTVTLYHWTAPV
jgi:hypothetical protein